MIANKILYAIAIVVCCVGGLAVFVAGSLISMAATFLGASFAVFVGLSMYCMIKLMEPY